jgi:exonuclease SbcC
MIKDMECENEKLQSRIKQLEKELDQTETVEEKMITEIVSKENMKNQYDSEIKSLKQKQEILEKEKEDSKVFYEKKIEALREDIKEIEAKDLQVREERNELKGMKLIEEKVEELEKILDSKTLELKELAINYEKQILEIRQNFEDSLETFKNNFKIQEGVKIEVEDEKCDSIGKREKMG